MKNSLKYFLFILAFGCLAFLLPQQTRAFQSAVEAAGDQAISVLLGEEITLMQYAENTQRDVVTVISGQKLVRVNSNGTYTFVGTGTVLLQDDIYTVDNEIAATYQWNIRVVNSRPVITDQPVSQTVYSGETAYFTLSTRQEEEFLEYQWIVTDASGMNCSDSIFGKDAKGWNSPTLTIDNCKSWMTGYRFYCMVKNAQGFVYTTMGPYPTLTVRKHPISNFLNITGLALPQAGVRADYSAEVDDVNCYIYSVEYYINGTKKDNYIPSSGDMVEVRITLAAADERYFTSAGDYTVIWNEFVNEGVSGTTRLTFFFSYEVPEEGESVYLPEESGYEPSESGRTEDSESHGGDRGDKPTVVSIVFGALLCAAVLALIVRFLVQQWKRENGE